MTIVFYKLQTLENINQCNLSMYYVNFKRLKTR